MIIAPVPSRQRRRAVSAAVPVAPALLAAWAASLLLGAPAPAAMPETLQAPASLAERPAGDSTIDPAAEEQARRRYPDVTDVTRMTVNARRALFKAKEQGDGGDVAGAVATLRGVLLKHSGDDHPLARFHLAGHLALSGRPEEALAEYCAAVALAPHYGQAWLKLAETAYELERFGEAGRAFARAFATLDEPDPALLYFGAASHLLDQRPEAAAPLLEELVSGRHGEPRLEWYRALLSASLEMKAPERGQAALDQLLARRAGDPEAWQLAFQFAASRQDYERAAVALTITGYLRPLSPLERLQLGDIYNAVGAPAAATVQYEQALADSSSTRDFERLASAYIAAHEQQRALHTLRRALEREPTVRLWALLGDLQYMSQQYDEAARAFGQCAALDPAYGRAHLMMGYCDVQLGRNEQALRHLQRAAEFPEQAAAAGDLIKRLDAMRSIQQQAAASAAAGEGASAASAASTGAAPAGAATAGGG